MEVIIDKLRALSEQSYREFSIKLNPVVDKDKVMGIRTPKLREYAKELCKDRELCLTFIKQLPHYYLEEYFLHVFIIEKLFAKDIQLTLKQTERVLPYFDNWAVCDTYNPKVFAKNLAQLRPLLQQWILSPATYTRRYAIVNLMRYFMENAFLSSDLMLVANSCNDQYYVNMAVAWYFSVALIKQYDSAVQVIEQKLLPMWTHNKAIQKAIESFRLTDEVKQYLRTLKRSE